jgi:hypothetical protein
LRPNEKRRKNKRNDDAQRAPKTTQHPINNPWNKREKNIQHSRHLLHTINPKLHTILLASPCYYTLQAHYTNLLRRYQMDAGASVHPESPPMVEEGRDES